MSKVILIVIGTRPNFVKITQFKKIAQNFKNIEIKIAHTGQHYDDNMSKIFFEQFELVPDYFLNVQGNSVCTQIADTIAKLDTLVLKIKPDIILAVGDVNSTLCASIVAKKNQIKLGHIESGLRSYDDEMPEENNRKVTDELADIFFVTENSGIENLLREGKPENAIHYVGNTMIDTLVAFNSKIESSPILKDQGLTPKEYILLTMHRPSNVDDEASIKKVINLVQTLSKQYKIVFPIHPRTENSLVKYGLLNDLKSTENFVNLPPLDYFAFQKLIANAKLIITDSGGIQEETTFVNVPCLTVRNNTERPSTIIEGTNELIEFDVSLINDKVRNSDFKKGTRPKFWDGEATRRIIEVLDTKL